MRPCFVRCEEERRASFATYLPTVTGTPGHLKPTGTTRKTCHARDCLSKCACNFCHDSALESEGSPNAILDFLVIVSPPIAPLLGSVHIRRALVIGLSQQIHDRQQDLLDGLDGRPSLGCMLVVIGVVTGRMEDRDADKAAGVDCG